MEADPGVHGSVREAGVAWEDPTSPGNHARQSRSSPRLTGVGSPESAIATAQTTPITPRTPSLASTGERFDLSINEMGERGS